MDFSIARRIMVERQVKARGINDALVLEAMLKVPRHLFVEEAFQSQAYSDFPLPIGEKQTISQPYIVGLMTEALRLKGGERVLEIGTGSGYQSAILSRIASRVYTVERLPDLARRARRVLNSLGCHNVNIKVSDGTTGWAEEAPFDGIMITAGAPFVSEEYFAQLAPGGRLVIPVGSREGQVLKRFTCSADGDCIEEILADCRFVPLLGRHGWSEMEG